MGLPAGLIWGLDPSDPSLRRDRDRLNGIDAVRGTHPTLAHQCVQQVPLG
jgi:hypothetical protein